MVGGMARANERVAGVLGEYADLLAITGGDAFKVRAYERAARSLAGWEEDVAGMDAEALLAVPGVGRSIASMVAEYLATGRIPGVERVREEVPAGVRELVGVPSLGPRTAMTLYERLGITSVDELAGAIRAGRLRGLKGFGPRTEERLMRGVAVLRESAGRVTPAAAAAVAQEVVAGLARVLGCVECAWAGSLRRMRESVGGVDVLVAAEDPAPFVASLTALPHAAQVVTAGAVRASVRTEEGLRVDLRVLPPRSWGAGLLYFTGSAAHNVRLRRLALRRGLTLSEYGLTDRHSGRTVASRTEEEVYAALGLPWIAPELREDRGEIEAAVAGELPDLVSVGDLRGDLHTHTDLTDGVATLEEMAAAAGRRGYAYFAVTDHAPDLFVQRMTDGRALAQRDRLERLGAAGDGPLLLHGTELNIGPQGELDWPDAFLAGFEVCVASVHSHFGQSRERMTRRLLRAVENPHVKVLGHPSARRLGRRGPVDADWDAVFAACARTGTALEVNGQPERLDLGEEQIAAARRHGVRFALDSDAHSVRHLGNVHWAAGSARRAWTLADEVVNTWPAARLRAFLRAGRPLRRAA